MEDSIETSQNYNPRESQYFEGGVDDLETLLADQPGESTGTKEISESVIQKEVADFRVTRQQIEVADAIDFQDRIFFSICTHEELKQIADQQANQCIKCNQKFNLMNKKHQCKFCGNLVCEQHSRKHRENPEKEGSFKRICDICEDKYLKKIINQEFKKKKDKFDKLTKQLEDKQQQILEQKKQKTKYYDEIKQRAQSVESVMQQDQMKLTMKINRIQQEIKSLKNEYTEDNEKLTKVDYEINLANKRIQAEKDKIKSKKNEEIEINNKIIAIEYDIKECQFIIDQIEKRITENNLRLEKIRVQKQTERSEKRQQQESLILAERNFEELKKKQELQNQEESKLLQAKKTRKKDKVVNGPDQQCGVKECEIF